MDQFITYEHKVNGNWIMGTKEFGSALEGVDWCADRNDRLQKYEYRVAVVEYDPEEEAKALEDHQEMMMAMAGEPSGEDDRGGCPCGDDVSVPYDYGAMRCMACGGVH